MSASAEVVMGGRAGSLPPMLTQYLDYKEKYPDALIFFQVGDFYELFFSDAVTVSKNLNLTLTSRDKNSPDPIPMCGVPIAVVDGYIERLVDLGFSVAVVSQAEAAVPGRGMVRRELDRIITPGVRIFGKSEQAESTNFVTTVYFEKDGDLALVYSDVQSGKLYVRDGLTLSVGQAEIVRLAPAELIVPQVLGGKKQDLRQTWLKMLQQALPNLIIKFRPDNYLNLATTDTRGFSNISGYASLSVVAKKAVRLLVSFIDEIICSQKIAIAEIEQVSNRQVVSLDANTRKHLEIVQNSKDGSSRGTLFAFLDRTNTVGGKKLLRQWLLNPLTNCEDIEKRQDAVQILLNSPGIRSDLIEHFKLSNDLERIAARTELSIVLPKELAALREALEKLPGIRSSLRSFLNGAGQTKSRLERLDESLDVSPGLLQLLQSALSEQPPYQINEGGIIRSGYNSELDRLRTIRKDGKKWIAELEASERELSGISSLKIKFNGVLGYFIEVTKANLSKVPSHYISRQSTVSGERFFTPELKEREREVLGAEQKQFELERELYNALRSELVSYCPLVRRIAAALSELDVLLSFAVVAEAEQLVRPVVNLSLDIEIDQGRHPVLAQILQGQFVPNDLQMSDQVGRCAIVTGPNMGGKSTYLRQAALIVLLAQTGSFVPAASATIGLVDCIFTRLGATDDLSEGESTFMVEMREAAAILSNASERSLLLIDEIGRGTATTDGLAIAQSILEWIVTRLKARTLFATHFRELTFLEKEFSGVINLSVGSIEQGSQVIFTHQICRGPAKKSYGIEVARLAGLPRLVLQRATRLINEFDRQKSNLSNDNPNQLSMFMVESQSSQLVTSDPFGSVVELPDDYDKLQHLRDVIVELDVNSLSPLEALNLLADLHSRAKA